MYSGVHNVFPLKVLSKSIWAAHRSCVRISPTCRIYHSPSHMPSERLTRTLLYRHSYSLLRAALTKNCLSVHMCSFSNVYVEFEQLMTRQTMYHIDCVHGMEFNQFLVESSVSNILPPLSTKWSTVLNFCESASHDTISGLQCSCSLGMGSRFRGFAKHSGSGTGYCMVLVCRDRVVRNCRAWVVGFRCYIFILSVVSGVGVNVSLVITAHLKRV